MSKDIPFFPESIPYKWDEHGKITEWKPIRGITLKDYFAGQALMGYLANSQYTSTTKESFKACSEWSYEIANSMLAQREINPS